MLFARFMAIYGHKFKSCFETQDEIRIAKREWALSLRGYGEAELVAAIDHCKERLAWMPTISEFLKILQDLGTRGLPGLQSAYQEACMHAEHPTRHDWSHPAVYHAGRATGWFRLRSEEQEQVLPDFRYHYGVMVRRARDGEDLTVPVPVALPDKRDNTLVAFIERWGEEQGLAPEVAASLLYYLTKPRGSKTRERFRAHARQEAQDKGLDVELPEDYQD
ncbi:hypothetical protein GCM10011348_25840 [Marinobacterium nitratireducens]|uniref:Uncharacterized protein n=1 Tax=Marinobacterium nitratireducens TaxID=518897 RepID=A0A918DUR2_9GAMM|nr:replication protein P [Marinobacterium nitratireducens]GGO83040.1 hypothetical protein GCM10011348_25840 [Marinobacterium nitratireducens]